MIAWTGVKGMAGAVALLVIVGAGCSDDASSDGSGSGSSGSSASSGDGDGDGDGDGGNNCPEGGANSGAPRTPSLGEPVLTTLEDQDSATTLRAGDLDGDGADDLLLSEIGKVLYYRSAGDGSFEPGAPLSVDMLTTFLGALEVADMDGDGVDDLIVGTQSADAENLSPVAVFWGGDGFPGEVTTISGGLIDVRADSIGVGDLDGDGVLDVAAHYPGSTFVSFGEGGRTFTETGPVAGAPLGTVLGVDVADLDADGKGEIAITSALFEYIVVDVGSDRSQQSREILGWGAIGGSPRWQDLNGDSAADITIGGSTHVYVAWNNGSGGFDAYEAGEYCTTEETLLAGGTPYFGVADWDRDGHLDLAVADAGDHQLKFMFGQAGTRDFTEYGSVPAADYNPAAVIPGDYDGDGIVDVGVFHDVSGTDGLFAVHPGQ